MTSTRLRSPTLPLNEDADGETIHETHNKKFKQNQRRKANAALHPENVLRAATRKIRASKNKRSTEITIGPPTSSMIHKEKWRIPAQKTRSSKQQNKQLFLFRERKTKSGRVSKAPERFGFT